MDAAIRGYSHKQKSPLCLLVYGTAIGMLVGAWLNQNEFPISLILGGSGVLMLFLAARVAHDVERKSLIRCGISS